MITKLKKGDMVKIKDGSWAVCVSKEWNEETADKIINPYMGGSTDLFEVVYVRDVWEDLKTPHDIFIKNTRTSLVYLHSSNLVERVDPEWFQGAKRGDRFYINNFEYILSHSGNGNASLINLESGNCKTTAVTCVSVISINKSEFINIVGDSDAKEVYSTKH